MSKHLKSPSRTLWSMFSLMVALAAPLTNPPAANAANFHPYGHRVANPYCITYGYWGLIEAARSATDWTIVNNTNPTDLNVCAIRVNQTQIVNVYNGSYPYVAAGRWDCRQWSGAFCVNGFVEYNLTYLSSTTQFRSVACHESGHAYGLGHLSDGQGGCMHEQNGVDTFYGFHNCCLMLNEMY